MLLAEKRSQPTKQSRHHKVFKKKTTKVTKKTINKTVSSKLTSKPHKHLKKKKDKPDVPSFDKEINHFVNQIESLSKAIDTTMKAMLDLLKKSIYSMGTFMKEKGVISTKNDGTKVYAFKPPHMSQAEKKIKDLTSSSLAVDNIPQIFLCSLIHKYDAYLSRLLHVAFYVKPELLSASEKSITFTDLMNFKSLESARESIIEKEVESVIRDSHIGHFDWMEKRFGIPLRKDLNIWPQFVEITERRNLFVHCDGIVSSQYLKVCKQQVVKLEDDLKVGTQLRVDQAYFRKAFDCIFEIGIKLGHVLWRKLQKDAIKESDIALHYTGYGLLTEERYELTKMLLHFATETLKTKSSDEIRRMNLINLCIAHKFSGDQIQYEAILDSEDWTACELKFKMAVNVLKDKFQEAAEIMEKIGTNSDVNREAYSTWPLFKEFRTSKEFLNTYIKLFGEEFVLPEETEITTKLSKLPHN